MTRACVPPVVALLALLAGCGSDGGPARTESVASAVPSAGAAVPTTRDVPPGVRRADLALADAGVLRLADLPEGWEQGPAGPTGTGENPTGSGTCPAVRRAWREATVWRVAGDLRVDDRYDLSRVLEQVVVVYPDADAAQESLDAFAAPATRGCVTTQAAEALAAEQRTAEYGTRVSPPQIAPAAPPTTGDAVRGYRVRSTTTSRGSVMPLVVAVDHTRVGRVVVELVGLHADDSELRQANDAAVARLVAAGARG